MGFYSYEVPRVVRYTEAEGGTVVARKWGHVEMGNQCSVGTVLQDEEFCGWKVVTVVYHVNVLNATLKNG